MAQVRAKADVVVRTGGHTETGRVRRRNEDRFAVVDLSDGADKASTTRLGAGGVLLCVCDGMGGAAAGDLASQIAVETICQQMIRVPVHADGDALAWALVDAIEAGNQAIRAHVQLYPEHRGMGTTATVAVVRGHRLLVGQVGDSRAYVLRNDRLVQITRDQSLANQLLDHGVISEAEVDNFPSQEIVQALGVVEELDVQLTWLDVRRGDRVLLCSDGLSGLVHKDVIEQVTATYDKVQHACERLAELANEAGGRDNITVAMCELTGQGLLDPSPDEGVRHQPYPLPKRANAPVHRPAPTANPFDSSLDEPVELPTRKLRVWPLLLASLLIVAVFWAWNGSEPRTGEEVAQNPAHVPGPSGPRDDAAPTPERSGTRTELAEAPDPLPSSDDSLPVPQVAPLADATDEANESVRDSHPATRPRQPSATNPRPLTARSPQTRHVAPPRPRAQPRADSSRRSAAAGAWKTSTEGATHSPFE